MIKQTSDLIYKSLVAGIGLGTFCSYWGLEATALGIILGSVSYIGTQLGKEHLGGSTPKKAFNPNPDRPR